MTEALLTYVDVETLELLDGAGWDVGRMFRLTEWFVIQEPGVHHLLVSDFLVPAVDIAVRLQRSLTVCHSVVPMTFPTAGCFAG
jgi:hypothetical protein